MKRYKHLPNTKKKKVISQVKRYLSYFEKNDKIKFAEGNASKTYFNSLSPGCEFCTRGEWSCFYVSGKCNQSCYFCPLPRIDRPSVSDTFMFNSSKQYINFLKKNNFNGVSFSGGEPFLFFDKITNYIKDIRKTFGYKHYIWIYTNGVLVTEQKLKLLKKLGVNELRFNIVAQEYNLKKVALAAKYIDNVTVEVPLIPEDLNKLKNLLYKLDKIGVKFLNIHQLFANKFNYNNISKRNYTLLKEYGNLFLVLDSELAAFKLLKYASINNFRVGINYCTYSYKDKFQSKAFRNRYVKFFLSKFYSATDIGYVRELFIENSKTTFKKINALLPTYKLSTNKKKIFFPEKYVKNLVDINHAIKINYYSPEFKDIAQNKKNDIRIKFGESVKFIRKQIINEISLRTKLEKLFFQKRFIEKKGLDQIGDELITNTTLNFKKKNFKKKLSSINKKFVDLEYLGNDFN